MLAAAVACRVRIPIAFMFQDTRALLKALFEEAQDFSQ